MPPLNLKPPWKLERHREDGERLLDALELIVRNSDGPQFDRRLSHLIIDWRVIRMFFRIAIDPRGDQSCIEWGYFKYVVGGVVEYVVGQWALRDPDIFVEDLAPTNWSRGHLMGALQSTLEEIPRADPEARIVDCVVVSTEAPLSLMQELRVPSRSVSGN